ncbi:hypothetical protein BGX38DRAFT_1195769, partial [Terfezia claveryi]
MLVASGLDMEDSEPLDSLFFDSFFSSSESLSLSELSESASEPLSSPLDSGVLTLLFFEPLLFALKFVHSSKIVVRAGSSSPAVSVSQSFFEISDRSFFKASVRPLSLRKAETRCRSSGEGAAAGTDLFLAILWKRLGVGVGSMLGQSPSGRSSRLPKRGERGWRPIGYVG